MKHSKNKLNKKGFTLAELLIVVAIIGVLVAISIPVYSKLVQKARLAANQANARAAYSAVEIQFLTSNHRSEGETYYTYDTETGQIGTVSSYDHNDFAGSVGDDWSEPSSWTTSTRIGGHWDWTPGRHVYKKWGLVVGNPDGVVRQYIAGD